MVPQSYKPKITESDMNAGSIARYFVKFISNPSIVEVDKDQYEYFKNNSYYTAIKIPWMITGNLNTVVTNNVERLGIEDQNKKIVQYFNQQLPGLNRKIKNFLQFANPTINQ